MIKIIIFGSNNKLSDQMSFKMTNILGFLTKNELFTVFCLKMKIIGTRMCAWLS